MSPTTVASATTTPVKAAKKSTKKASKVAKAAKKGKKADKVYEGPSRAERVEAAHAQLVTHLETMVTGEDWATFLKLAARFHHYSAGNCMLINMQCPEATKVASFTKWREMGRNVRRGEHGITILAPCRIRIEGEDDEDDRFALRGFRAVTVFDISQTAGDDVEEIVIAKLLEGEAPDGMFEAISTMIEANGFEVSFGDTGDANGSTDWAAKKVLISSKLEPGAAAKTLVHELTHVLQTPDHRRGLGRETLEIEAESVAYMVCNGFGLESAPYSIGYVAGWSGGDLAKVRTTAEWVVKTAHAILKETLDHEEEVAV